MNEMNGFLQRLKIDEDGYTSFLALHLKVVMLPEQRYMLR
jgi:hypothetical protein